MKAKIQKIGRFLSGMVMPNIGALIAFGLFAAFFIPTGWLPNEELAKLVTPMLTFCIPLLIAGQGGQMIGGLRGRITASIAVIGAIVSNLDVTMLMASMIVGPFAGWCIKKFDQFMEPRMPAGFEMLINNFSVGIIGMILAMLSFLLVGPFMTIILDFLSMGVDFLINLKLLPLVAIFIEPAKVLFLNNAINHGIFTPIAMQQAADAGKSIMYMLEANPGPGFGVLLAYWLFCKDKTTRDSAPGAIIIQLFGGIHEIYFPYVLMHPAVIIAPICGNICAITWFMLTNTGLVGPASPGSIIAFMMMSGNDWLNVAIGFLIAAGVSFGIAIPIVKRYKGSADDLEGAKQKSASNKSTAPKAKIKKSDDVDFIVFACDAGMGSSAMGATKFRKRITAVRPDITVQHSQVDEIPAECQVAVVQKNLSDRAKKAAPHAQLVIIDNFLNDPNLDILFDSLQGKSYAEAEKAAEEKHIEQPAPAVIVADGIKLGQKAKTKEDAIKAAGKLIVELGLADQDYANSMLEREKTVSTYMGMGVAIPHGTSEAKEHVKKTGIVFLQYPDGVDFGGEDAQLVFGIAGVGDEHLEALSSISELIEDEKLLEKLKTTDDADWVLDYLTK